MDFVNLTVGFWLAIITFQINRRVQKMTNIKIALNSLFDMFGDISAIREDYEYENVKNILLNEIINLEKLHDNNYYVTIELRRLKKLQNIYYKLYKEEITEDQAIRRLKNIKFNPLNKSFIVLAFFNIKITYFSRDY